MSPALHRIFKSAVIGAAIETPLAICAMVSRFGIDNASHAGFLCAAAHLPAVLLLSVLGKSLSSSKDPAWPRFAVFLVQAFLISVAVWLGTILREYKQSAR